MAKNLSTKHIPKSFDLQDAPLTMELQIVIFANMARSKWISNDAKCLLFCTTSGGTCIHVVFYNH